VVVLVSAPLVRVPLHMLERPVSGCRPSLLELAIVDDKQKQTNKQKSNKENMIFGGISLLMKDYLRIRVTTFSSVRDIFDSDCRDHSLHVWYQQSPLGKMLF